MKNITTRTDKDEIVTAALELTDGQQAQIDQLRQERAALTIIAAFLLITTVIL